MIDGRTAQELDPASRSAKEMQELLSSVRKQLRSDPVPGLRLLVASMLWGMGFAVVLMALAALAHVVTNTSPIWDVQLKILFALLTSVGTIWRTLAFWQAGWFGRTDYFQKELR